MKSEQKQTRCLKEEIKRDKQILVGNSLQGLHFVTFKATNEKALLPLFKKLEREESRKLRSKERRRHFV